MAREYKTKEFPPDEELKKKALQCPMIAYCPDRPYSFCLKRYFYDDSDKGWYFRKITFKHCYECQHGVEY